MSMALPGQKPVNVHKISMVSTPPVLFLMYCFYSFFMMEANDGYHWLPSFGSILFLLLLNFPMVLEHNGRQSLKEE